MLQFSIMEEFIRYLLHQIAFVIGVVGVIIILLGLIDALVIYIKNKRNFAKIRYVIGKHILLGLDFLVVKDILETVFLRGSDVKGMDIILLIVIVAIRVVLTKHTSQGVQEMHREILQQKHHSQVVDKELDYLETEEEKLERQILELKESDVESEEKRKQLELKVKELAELLKKNKRQRRKRK